MPQRCRRCDAEGAEEDVVEFLPCCYCGSVVVVLLFEDVDETGLAAVDDFVDCVVHNRLSFEIVLLCLLQ